MDWNESMENITGCSGHVVAGWRYWDLTTYADAISVIQALLGPGDEQYPDGVDLAEAVFDVLERRELVTLDALHGYDIALPDDNDGGQFWCEILREADQDLRGE